MPNPSKELLFQIAFLQKEKGIMLSSFSVTKLPIKESVCVLAAKRTEF
jgi:hypothetical protein